MTQIIPAILATTEQDYKDKIQELENSDSFEGGWIQIDLMDNKFVQNQSIGPEVLAKYKTPFRREAQLMVEYPEGWIEELVKVRVERIVFPTEDAQGVEERINHIKNHNIGVGLSINPETRVEKIVPFMGTIDLVLVMGVNPGFGGQEFIPDTIEKVKELFQLRSENNLNFLIEVDGGVNLENIKSLVDAGVDNLVIGSYLFDGDITENLEKIWETLQG